LIFVTVGNATQKFRRLLDAVEDLIKKKILDRHSVLIQKGNNPDFSSEYCQSKPFLPMDEFEQFMQKSDLIISHGGCGTLLHAIRLGKIPIVMPRRKKYGEHVNDHQIQLVQSLANEGRIIPAYEPEDLPHAIARAKQESRQLLSSQTSRMFGLVAKGIEELTHP
jgi:UDP-N-acetylglucosamine transferase subunit ALG13